MSHASDERDEKLSEPRLEDLLANLKELNAVTRQFNSACQKLLDHWPSYKRLLSSLENELDQKTTPAQPAPDMRNLPPREDPGPA